MILQRNRIFPVLIPLLLLLSSCGGKDSAGGDVSINESLTPPGASKDLGLLCLTEGDLACAKKNYCAIRGDAQAGFRCCLATFLETYLSENTQALGVMLGYDPADWEEIRASRYQDLLDDKALPFGELFLLSQDEAPAIKELLKQWGIRLVTDRASTSELLNRLGRFGSDLEPTLACLDANLGSFQADTVEKEIFQNETPLEVGPRDLYFLRFVLGAVSYLTQAAQPYDLGAKQFPSWPPSDEFLADVNGLAGEGDARFGDLDAGEAKRIAALDPALVQAFDALKSFSALKGSPGKIDAYLNWRFSSEFQEKASAFLKAAHASLTAGWQTLPGGHYQLNLGSLAQSGAIPDAHRVSQEQRVLVRDDEGDADVNGDFFQEWAAALVRPAAE